MGHALAQRIHERFPTIRDSRCVSAQEAVRFLLLRERPIRLYSARKCAASLLSRILVMSATAQSVSVPSAGTKTKQPSGWDHLKHLLPYVVRYKGMSFLGLLSLTLMGLVGALPQLIIASIMDCLKGSPQALATLSGPSRTLLHPLFSFYAPMSRHALGIYCLLLVGVMLVKGFLSLWSSWILIGISREIEYDLRNDLLSRLLRLEPEFYVRNRTGDLMSRATNDLNAVRMVLGPGIMYSATTLATMVLAIFFMAKLSPSLTLWVLIPLPFVAVAVRYFGQVIHRLSERIQAALGVLSTRAQENLTGIRVIRAYVQEKSEVGLVTGLAWSEMGGSILQVEVQVLDGKGKMTATGQLGDVMQESTQAALTYIRSRSQHLGLAKDFYRNIDIHIHVPEGAIPKDGPSAGIALATALASALTKIEVRRDIAMTGEITLRGKVLPIGGLKEKLLAAHRACIFEAVLPAENIKDLSDLPELIKNEMKLHFVEQMDEVLEIALAGKLPRLAEETPVALTPAAPLPIPPQPPAPPAVAHQ